MPGIIKRSLIALCVLLLVHCRKEGKTPPIDHAVDLDGRIIFDSSLIRPADFLLSARYPSPSTATLQKPVIIAVHGFSASNFEWKDFHAFADQRGDVLVSRVLLGAHGRTYEDFKRGNWREWQQAIIDEYCRLVALGYKNISLAGSSTGGALVLEMISASRVDHTPLRHVFLVDPIVVPSDKKLSLAPLVGGRVIDYVEKSFDPGEVGYWYRFWPQQALRELNKLTIFLRKKLEKEIQLPDHTKLKVFKSERDNAADPLSAVLIKKGVPGSEVEMVPSSLHVFTRLAGRATVTDEDRQRQTAVFTEMCETVNR